MQEFHSFYKRLPLEPVKLPKGLTWPVKYAVIRNCVENNTFGEVRRNRNGSIRVHQGWDFYAPVGYGCYAIADGKVVAVRNGGAYGRQIIVEFEHDFNDDGRTDTLYAAYCHLSAVDVRRGDRVTKGQRIAEAGDSGNARGMRGRNAHLHFEIRHVALPGRGLKGRMSPYALFKKDAYPIRSVMIDKDLW